MGIEERWTLEKKRRNAYRKGYRDGQFMHPKPMWVSQMSADYRKTYDQGYNDGVSSLKGGMKKMDVQQNGTPEVAEKKKRPAPVRLNNAQKYKLTDWLRVNDESLSKTSPPYKEAADIASGHVGFKVDIRSLLQVRKTLKEAGIELKWIPKQKQAYPQDLARHLADLYRELGKPVPDQLVPYLSARA